MYKLNRFYGKSAYSNLLLSTIDSREMTKGRERDEHATKIPGQTQTRTAVVPDWHPEPLISHQGALIFLCTNCKNIIYNDDSYCIWLVSSMELGHSSYGRCSPMAKTTPTLQNRVYRKHCRYFEKQQYMITTNCIHCAFHLFSYLYRGVSIQLAKVC